MCMYIKMMDLKQEVDLYCCCCSGDEELLNMLELQKFSDKTETCIEAIARCFQTELKIEIVKNNMYAICMQCLRRLKDIIKFRNRIQNAYNCLQDILETENFNNVKNEPNCCCCFSGEDLLSMLEPNNHEGRMEIYAAIIAESFGIELKNSIGDEYRNMFVICRICVYDLRNAREFRYQIQTAYNNVPGCKLEPIECFQNCPPKNEKDFNENKFVCGVIKTEEVNPQNGLFEGCPLRNANDDYEIKIEFDPITSEEMRTVNRSEESFFNDGCLLKHTMDAIRPSNCLDEHKKSKKRTMNGHSCKYDNRLKSFACDMCDRCFSLAKYLKDHKKNTHSTELKNMAVFTCRVCDKTFPKKNRLHTHMLKHLGITFSCDRCDKTFTQKSSLNTHVRKIHSVSDKLVCDTCDKTFTHKSNLTRHVLIHLGIRKLSCRLCGKTFAENCALERHTFSHFEVKRFTCDICNKSFTDKNYLANHIVLHSGTKSFVCGVCNKTFSLYRYLNNHRRNMHPDQR